ncbi:MAG: hypothetical protein LBK75_01605 [Oscillospiraceae bacterium]|jgi:hypothetical protein|nr:hypothetical protein [Oscillospiraceae bacterium]
MPPVHASKTQIARHRAPGLLAAVFLAGCLLGAGAVTTLRPVLWPEKPADVSTSSAALVENAFTVVNCLKQEDFAKLADWVHPEKGILFVPYSTVLPERNLLFTAAEVRRFASDKNVYIWGVTDGEGAPIQSTPVDFFRRYLNNRDYTQASVVGVNTLIKTGNATENVAEAFPEARFVELNISMLDPAQEGLDWSSLKIVFENVRGAYKVVAIIHSQWTN